MILIKKLIIRIFFYLFIIMAALGVGLTGAATLHQATRRKEFPEISIEMIDEKDTEDLEEGAVEVV